MIEKNKIDYIRWSKSRLPKSIFNSMDMEVPPYHDVFSKMLSNRITFLSGEINLYSCEILKSQILYLDSLDDKDITIYINSPGGSVYDGLGLLDIMEYVSSDIVTINTGLAASMGAIILCSGTKGKRKALKRSRTMIHQPLSFGYAQQQASDLEIEAKEINLLKRELCEIISKKTNQKYNKVVQDCDRDYWLSAKDSLDYGLIDTIVK